MRERTTIPVALLKTAAMALGMWLAFGAPPPAHAQEGVPLPPPLGAYFWFGPPDGSGNGDAGDWKNNWSGRYIIHAGSPPTTEGLPPIDGDTLYIREFNFFPDIHHTVTLPSLDLPSSGMTIAYDSDFSGGSLNLNGIDITTIDGMSFPNNFNGTSFSIGNSMGIRAGNDAFTFTGVQIRAGDLAVRGGNPNIGPNGTTPTVNFSGATVNASTISVANTMTPGQGLFVTKATNSQIQSLGMKIGLFGQDLADATEVNLNRSQAMVSQYLLVGSEGGGRLRLADQSTATLSDANNYVNVGDHGEGDLIVTQTSTLTSNALNIAVAERGTMTVDHGGKVISQSGTIGVQSDFEGTVTLADDAKWQTKDLTVGENGTGYVFVYDEATLHIDGQAILGHAEGSHGFLNLIGADTKLELGPNGKLTIGDEGAGLLSLADGAKFTSLGDVNLGEIEASSGTVVVDGQDGPSTWSVAGALNIGVAGVGRVELNKGGKLTTTSAEIVLGSGLGGDGTLVLDGPNSTIVSDGEFVVGRKSKGTLTIDNGAIYNAKKIVVGEQPGSQGLIEVKSSQTGNTQFSVTESLHLGEMSKGTLTVDSASLETSGEAKLALTSGVAGEATLSHNAIWRVQDGSTLTVGSLGPGTVNVQSGSTLKVSGNLVLADGGTSTGNVTLTGFSVLSVVNNGTIVVGKQGTANLNIQGGSQYTSTSSAKLTVGSENGGVGTITVTGNETTFTSLGDLFVGKSSGSTGTIVLDTGGLLNITPASDPNSDKGFILGFDQGSKGTLNIKSTTASNGFEAKQGVVVIGRAGEGTLMIRGGLNQSPSTDFALATESSGKGTISMSSGNALLVGHDFDIGLKGPATLTVDDHAVLKAHQLNVGNAGSVTVANDAQMIISGGNVKSENIFNLNSGGSVSVDDGDFLTNSVTHIGGESEDSYSPSIVHAKNFRIGPDKVATADVTDGAKIVASNELSISQSGSKLTIQGSSLDPSTAKANKVIVGSGSQLIVSGGGLLNAGGAGNPALAMQIDVFATLDVEGADSVAEVHGQLASSGGILVHNNGRLSADRVLVPRGGYIDLAGGRMIVGGDLDDVPNIATNTLLVRPGGIVQANRDRNFLNNPVIKGKFINGGELIIGQSPGSVLVDGDFTQQSTGKLMMEVGGFSAGVDYDQLVVNGNLSLGGAVNVQFIHGFAPHAGDEWSMFNFTGSLDAQSPTFVFPNLELGFLYDTRMGTDGLMLHALSDGTIVKLPGDFDRDGSVTPADLPAMLTALTDLSAWKSSYGASDADLLTIGDLDHSGAVTNRDIQSLINLLASQGSGTLASVPEPSSLILIACGGALCCAKDFDPGVDYDRLVVDGNLSRGGVGPAHRAARLTAVPN